jgi:hypothetical protein
MSSSSTENEASDAVIPGVIVEEDVMRPRSRGGWIVMGIAVLGAMIVGGREAGAGITIGGGELPTTKDPTYDYQLQVYLQPGNSITTGDSFTIDNLPGVVSSSVYSSLGLPTYSTTGEPDSVTYGADSITFLNWTPSISALTSATSPYASDVTWTFSEFTVNLGNGTTTTGSIVNPASSTQALYLGEFDVVTAVNFATAPPLPSGSTVDYTYTVTTSSGMSPGSGSFQIDLLTPEPSSATIVLLAAGTAGFFGLIVRTRRRRAARASADRTEG